jgi:FlaA1/EpsC-like NDP-sugar epimerase
VDIAAAMHPSARLKEIGIREGEKIHEVMITEEDSLFTHDYDDHYIIYPHFEWWDTARIKKQGKKVSQGFRYSSDSNERFLDVKALKGLLQKIEIIY